MHPWWGAITHTISCQIWGGSTKKLRAAASWASTAAAGRGQTIRAIGCGAVMIAGEPPWQLAASKMGNPTLPSVLRITLLSPPCWQKHLWDFSDRGLGWKLGFCLPGFDCNQIDLQTQLPRGGKGQPCSKLRCTEMSSETFSCKIRNYFRDLFSINTPQGGWVLAPRAREKAAI